MSRRCFHCREGVTTTTLCMLCMNWVCSRECSKCSECLGCNCGHCKKCTEKRIAEWMDEMRLERLVLEQEVLELQMSGRQAVVVQVPDVCMG